MPDTADVMQLLDDGRVSFRISDVEYLLREPLIKEWRSFIADYTKAERRVILSTSQLTEALGTDEQDEMDLTDNQETKGPAYATVLLRIIRTLTGEAMDLGPGDLPAWCGMPEVILALEHHWTHVPLAIGSQPKRMVPHNMIPAAVGMTTIQQRLDEQLSQAMQESTPS